MNTNTILTNLRQDVVRRVLLILASIAVIAILFITVQEWNSGNRLRLFLVYWPALFFIILITFVKTIPGIVRSIVLVSLFLSVALSELISFGLASLTYMFFVAAVSLTAVIFSKKAGYIAMAGSLIPIAVTAFFYTTGKISIVNNQQLVSTEGMGWVSSTLAYLVACASLMETVTIMIKKLVNYNLKIKSLNMELEGLVEKRNIEISLAVENSSRDSTLVSVQTAFPKMFHQLNTPIGNALTAISYMRENSSEDENRKALLDISLKSLEQARAEIGKLRLLSDFMNPETYVSPIDFCDFIRDNEDIIGSNSSAEIEYIFEIDHFIAEIEPIALIEVLNILLQNACDHAQTSTPIVSIKFRIDADGGLELLVTDNGPGITPEEKPFIFEPFHSKAGIGRMGLGLTIARNITESRLGGTLTLAESSSGIGACFLIHLPLNDKAHLTPLSEAVT